MTSKVVVMLVLCFTFVLAVQTIKPEFLLVEYGKCFKNCHDNCQTQDDNDAFCKLKCDNECMAKKMADKLYKVKDDIVASQQSAQSSIPMNADGPPALSSKPSSGESTANTEPQVNKQKQPSDNPQYP